MNIRGTVALGALVSSLELWGANATPFPAEMFTETFDGGITPFTACTGLYQNGITYTYSVGTDCVFCFDCGPNDLTNILEGDSAGTLRLEFDCPQDITTFELRESVGTGSLTEVVNVKTFSPGGALVTNQNVNLGPVPGSFFDGALVGVASVGSLVAAIEIDFSIGVASRFAVDEFKFDTDPRNCECTLMPVTDSPFCADFDPTEHVYVAGDCCTYFYQCYGGTNWGCNPCPDGLLFDEFGDPPVCKFPGDVVCRDPLEWQFATTGIGANGGWSTSNGGLCVRIDIEDSFNCGGGNSNTQTGTAEVTFDIGYDYDLSAVLTGIVEYQDAGFEILTVTVDGALVLSAESLNLDEGCNFFGDPDVTEETMQPYQLTAGTHTIKIEFTSNDSLFHVDAFYELCLDFGPPAGGPGCCTDGELFQATTDCAGFVQCISPGVASQPQMCMGDLKFNPEIFSCVSPATFTCVPDLTCMPMGGGFDRRLDASATKLDHKLHKLRGGL